MGEKLSWDKATSLVTNFLTAELKADGRKDVSPKIYLWDDNDPERRLWLGPRVAEVDFIRGNSGSSFMQVDVPHGAAVCLCTERLIIAYAEGDWGDDLFDEEWRLCIAVFNRGPKTKVAPLEE